MISRRFKALLGNFLARFIVPREGQVVFVTKARVPFGGNLRAVADEMLAAKGNRVFVYSDGSIDDETRRSLETAGATVLSGFSLAHLLAILKSSVVFVSHSIRDAHLSRKHPGRRVINLWHGVPLKRIELHMIREDGTGIAPSRKQQMFQNAAVYDQILACNTHDHAVMAGAFGVPLDKVLVNGLPRFDFMQSDFAMPVDFAAATGRLQALAMGRNIVTYAPTFRESGASPFTWMNNDVKASLRSLALANNLVIALRPHPYDLDHLKQTMYGNEDIFIDASSRHFPEAAIVLRQTSALLTDYSSIWIDYLMMGLPIVGLVPDYANYMAFERGFMYDLTMVFPGPLCADWPAAIAALNHVIKPGGHANWYSQHREAIEKSRELFLAREQNEGYTRTLLKKLKIYDAVHP
jgi:CDP-glycerol glycerophosphotransferase (TagB/SpsB family)